MITQTLDLTRKPVGIDIRLSEKSHNFEAYSIYCYFQIFNKSEIKRIGYFWFNPEEKDPELKFKVSYDREERTFNELIEGIKWLVIEAKTSLEDIRQASKLEPFIRNIEPEIPVLEILKISPHGNFITNKIGESLAICEAARDPHNWGNQSSTDPAFVTYLGCESSEVQEYIEEISRIYIIPLKSIIVRRPKYLKDFERELKIKGMQRYTDHHRLGLDHLIESEAVKHGEPDYDEYNYKVYGIIA